MMLVILKETQEITRIAMKFTFATVAILFFRYT